MHIFSPMWRARWKSRAARVDTNAPAYQQWKKVFGVELWSTGARQVSTRSRAQGPQYPNLECPPGLFCPICPNFVSQTIAKSCVFLKSFVIQGLYHKRSEKRGSFLRRLPRVGLSNLIKNIVKPRFSGIRGVAFFGSLRSLPTWAK